MITKIIFLLSVIVSINHVMSQTIYSPNENLRLTFELLPDGTPTYHLSSGNMQVLLQSRLGIELKDHEDFISGFVVESVDTVTFDETWETVWGEERFIRNHHKEMAVTLMQPGVGNRRLVIRFRLFDDGLGFRYEFPAQGNLHSFIVTGESTQFRLTGNHTAFWIPGDYDTNEYPYNITPLSQIDAFKASEEAIEIFTRKPFHPHGVQTPLLLKTATGHYILIHEAALHDYPAMQLVVNKEEFLLTSHLVPDAVGNKAYLQTPCHTPWRTVIVSNKAAGILASRLILNLNEPSILEDVSWIKPQKYIGIWWEMHVGISSWNYADTSNVKLAETDWNNLIPNNRHGATTERTKRYIDFAADHGFHGVLVEGWNIGWEDWFGQWKEEVFDFVTPYPDFDIEYVNRYAASRGVKLVMHHETSGSVTNYERRLDTAFRLMKHFGYDVVKTGYVGWIIPRGEHHDGQWMVNHYRRVAGKAAKYRIMVNAHEQVRPTGLHRTFPNWFTAEAARGNEFNAWSRGNPPAHETILPFTRLMGGPMDYTPGIFQITLDYYNIGKTEQVRTTLAKQLALYVTMYSPLQMAADLPENYERFPDAFQFIKDVPVDWEKSLYVEANPGHYLTIARQERSGDDWFIGSITGDSARLSTIPLSFLDKGQMYLATIYSDAPDAHYRHNPMAYKIEQYLVNSSDVLRLQIQEGGGAAVKLSKADKTIRGVRRYR